MISFLFRKVEAVVMTHSWPGKKGDAFAIAPAKAIQELAGQQDLATTQPYMHLVQVQHRHGWLGWSCYGSHKTSRALFVDYYTLTV